MSKTSSADLSAWLNATPALSVGARAYLAARLRKRAIPFIPICAFGFALDEAGPEMNGPRLNEEPGAALTGG
jgi:hypothetical protein